MSLTIGANARAPWLVSLVLGAVCAASSELGAAAQTAPAASTTAPRGAPPSGVPPRTPVEGYLGTQVPDHRVFLPPPPAPGSPAATADAAIFSATRALENGPRWQLAASDDQVGQKALLGDFGCAVGLDLAAASAPALSRLLARSGADAAAVFTSAKDSYRRPRPFLTETPAPICVTPSEAFAKSGSYPSAHATVGWLYALLLAELDPEHAAAIAARGRAYGESRVVCGVHYLSDVEAGRLTAATVVAALHGMPEFEADVAAARAELAALRHASGAVRTAGACENEAASLATPW
jgi:acid phosphatase (class A)